MKNGYKIVFVIFLLLSIAGIFFVANILIEESKMETVFAVCERREFARSTSYRGLTTDYYYCFMNYDYDGASYSTAVESSTIGVGGQLKIKVNPQNPTSYKVASNYIYLSTIVCIPVVLSIFFGICEYKEIKDRKNNNIKREE